MISVVEYFDMFVNVMLGIGLVFEMPIIIFFLTLLRLASPRFLLAHSRYAILGIVILAAIVTPTPDVFNLMLFATPMCLLFFVGIFASYLLVLKREGRAVPVAQSADLDVGHRRRRRRTRSGIPVPDCILSACGLTSSDNKVV